MRLFQFFFAPQPCQDCGTVRPISELAPIVSETGTWAGFRCLEPLPKSADLDLGLF